MEMVFLLVWKMRQNIEFQKSRSMVQALLAQTGAESKAILDAFENLKEAFFPFDQNEKEDEKKRMKEAMLKEISRGPISVTPLQDPNRKKVASRLGKGQAELARRQALTESGRATNIDAFNKARTRPRGAS